MLNYIVRKRIVLQLIDLFQVQAHHLDCYR